MDFDSRGGLWVSVGEFVTCITPPPPTNRFLYLSDPWSGDPQVTIQPTTPNYLPTLAMDVAPTSLAEIPTLGTVAEITFALLLACVGAWFLVARVR